METVPGTARQLTKNEFALINSLHQAQRYYRNGKPTARYMQMMDRENLNPVMPTLTELVKQQLVVRLPYNYRGGLSWYAKLTRRGELAALAFRQAVKLTEEKAAQQERLFDDGAITRGTIVYWTTPDGKQEKRHIALRNDNEQRIWVVDGGL